MNPMTNVKNIKKLSEQDIKLGGKSSWHDQYKDSAWIFIGGLPYDLTEGDIICVFSQYGEIVNINLVRDKDSGKQKGFCFLCYEDQRSTILAVDNLNSIKLLGRTLRVDHVENYKAPKEGKKNPIDDETRLLREEGCAPQSKAIHVVTEPQIKTEDLIVGGVRLPPRLPIGPIKTEPKDSGSDSKKSKKKHKKNKDMDKLRTKIKKEKKSKKKKRKQSTSSSSDSSSDSDSDSQSSESEEEKRRRRKKHRK